MHALNDGRSVFILNNVHSLNPTPWTTILGHYESLEWNDSIKKYQETTNSIRITVEASF